MASGGQAATLNAVVIGGTGATGSHLVGTLLKAKDVVAKVTVMGRRKMESVPEQHGVDLSAEETEGRLVQHVEDLDTVSDDTVKQLCTGGHVFFNCLGTTRARAGSAEAFRHIDYEIPTRLSRLAREAGVDHCVTLTSWGSNPNSWMLYFRSKGEVETAAREMQFPRLTIFRPGALDRGVGGFTYYLGKLFRHIPVATVAEAMALDAYAYHARQQQSAPEGATPTSPEVEVVTGNSVIRQLVQAGSKSEEPTPPAPQETPPAPQETPPASQETQ